MKSFQDRLCNVLTLLGLTGVIVGGIYSLVSDEEGDTPGTEQQAQVSTPPEQIPQKEAIADTLAKKPQKKASPKPYSYRADSSQTYRTKSVQPGQWKKDSTRQSVPDSVLSQKRKAVSPKQSQDSTRTEPLPTTKKPEVSTPEVQVHTPDSTGQTTL